MQHQRLRSAQTQTIINKNIMSANWRTGALSNELIKAGGIRAAGHTTAPVKFDSIHKLIIRFFGTASVLMIIALALLLNYIFKIL